MGVKSVLVPFMPQADLCAYGMFTQDLADAAVFRGNCRAAVHGGDRCRRRSATRPAVRPPGVAARLPGRARTRPRWL